MKIAIIGSRNWADEQAIINFVDTLPSKAMVISGGARGVDAIAIRAAQLCGIETLVFPANWGLYGKKAGMIRNGDMIKDKPDMVVAFWDGSSSGTANMIKRAKKAGIPVVINPIEFAMPTIQRRIF